ncbi:DUF423 domain-containing protein [Brevundimonas sp. SORGH_AS_0993]|uniref:DUF423 domain-containing protein n=1 Tax=Brevundimonas sp. SORGH_AS_0993 TaxID=3041794 RepID=UPI00277F9EAB|nr:DUF423 domain-containing protein [Brevundimonas sp. SORGH_AS_0993]MDQ1153818.1 uncharacterized membrane protein YgdD (TMEM256/DUF423 family) [Brevundimonas sp. SORGH_AS_0993]
MTADRNLIVFAALNGALAVVLGAFAAHGAGPQIKTLLQTGSHYQLGHAVFALACALWTGGGGLARLLARLAGWLGAAGGLVFSLALGAIGLLGLPVMGAVAPIGGLLMIAGWLCLAFAALRS